VLPLWNDLYAAHADVVPELAHAETYERFAPQTPAAILDTGPRDPGVHRRHGRPRHVVVLHDRAQQPGARAQVLRRLEIHALARELFLEVRPIAGTQFSDSGSAACHKLGAPPPPPPPPPPTPAVNGRS